MTADESEKASVDLWSGAGYSRMATALNERKAEMDKRPIRRPQRARKGKIPMVGD
jgi:hypothetical protein